MKKVIYLIFSALMLLNSCTEKLEQRVIYTHPDNSPATVEFYRPNDSTKQAVKIVRYYANGERQEETNYKNALKDGLSTWWYMNGEKMYEANYKDNVYNGSFVQWYENGEKEYEAEYTSGKPSGTWKYYAKDGSLQKEQKF